MSTSLLDLLLAYREATRNLLALLTTVDDLDTGRLETLLEERDRLIARSQADPSHRAAASEHRLLLEEIQSLDLQVRQRLTELHEGTRLKLSGHRERKRGLEQYGDDHYQVAPAFFDRKK